jgi:hypothetical protein
MRSLPVTLAVRACSGRVTLRAIGYGAIVSVFLMLGLRWEPRGILMCLLAGTPVIVGPIALVLLVSRPGVSRREGWFICALLWVFLAVLVLPAFRID